MALNVEVNTKKLAPQTKTGKMKRIRKFVRCCDCCNMQFESHARFFQALRYQKPQAQTTWVSKRNVHG